MVTTTPESAPTDTDQTDPAGLSRSFFVAAALAAGLTVVTYLLTVRTGLGQRFDNAALAGSMQQNPSARLNDILFLGHISSTSFAGVLLGIVIIGFIRRRWLLGVTLALTALVSVNGTDLLKNHVLTRPQLVSSDQLRPQNSFPSGHTAVAISCAFALVVIAPPVIRGLVAILAGGYSWTVAADVQTAGWHRASDAIGATLLCFAIICVVVAVLVRTRPANKGNELTHIPAYLVLGLVWLFSLTLAIYNAIRVLRVLDRTADTAQLDHALLTHSYEFSVNLTVAIVATALIALLVLLGRYDLDARRLTRRR
jgi:membrane-associated phospholipid phosphatase